MTTVAPAATILLSGGLDSSVLLHHVAAVCPGMPLFVLSFNYGQKHARELEMARWQAGQVPAVREHTVCDMGFFADLAGGASAIVRGGAPVPDLADLGGRGLDQPPTYVPNRNMVLLALAAAYAESRGCASVYYGAQAQDEYGYWDCTAGFVGALNAVLAQNRRLPVRIEAPFVGAPKSACVRRGLELGVDFSHTWSCYRGGERPCGLCPTCVERANAFAAAGAADPLIQG